MSVIVTDAGFAPEDWTQPVVPLAEMGIPILAEFAVPKGWSF